MSRENVDLVLEGIRRFQASDFEGVARLWQPDSWITDPEGWPEPGPFEGREAVIAQFRRLAEDWGENRFPDTRVVADRGDWVVVALRWEVRGGRSGIVTTADIGAAYRLRDGRMCEGHFRWTAADALEAAGLSE